MKEKNAFKIGAMAVMLLLLVGGVFAGTVSAKQEDGGNEGKGKKDLGNVTTESVVAWVDSSFDIWPSSGSMSTRFFFYGDAKYYYTYGWPYGGPIITVME